MLFEGVFFEERASFIKFLLVGCLNFIISFSVFYFAYNYGHIGNMILNRLGILGEDINRLLVGWGVESVDGTVATVCGYLCGMVNSFFWNRGWTFKSDGKMSRQFPCFLFLNMLCLFLSAISIFIFVDAMRLPYKMVWLITMSFVTILNYLGNKWWVFKKRFFRNAFQKTEAFWD